MCHTVLNDASFYELLFRFDQDLAAEVRAGGCPYCGGVRHSARYPRKPRGGPRGLGPEYETRLSFCCAASDCRRRTTPPSVRFLGRRVYLGAVVVLISALANGVSVNRAAWLGERLGVSRRTLQRWRRWWREHFVATPFWQAVRGRFLPPLERTGLPAVLLERVGGGDDDLATKLFQLLRFLTPLTTNAEAGGQGGLFEG